MILFRPLLTTAFALSIVAASAVTASALTQVGVTGAVNPESFGIQPESQQQLLSVGDGVVYQERIRTEAGGRAEILFLDRSSLNVGPDADVVIDDFVYSPQNGTGTLAISATKGVLRYIGGAISKNEDSVTINTPTAVIGIRGGIAVVEVGTDGTTRALFVYGREMTIQAHGGEIVRITRPGFASSIGKNAARPSTPAKASGTQLALAVGPTTSKSSTTATVNAVSAAVTKMPAVTTVSTLKATTVNKAAATAVVKASAPAAVKPKKAPAPPKKK